MRVRTAWIVGGLAGLAIGLGAPFAVEAHGQQESQAAPRVVPHSKFQKVVQQRRAADREVRRLRATLRQHPDFEVSLQLAAIAYGQDWRHLYRCALSEGAREEEVADRYNRRPNAAGSGAYSSFQFMRGTFLSTPYRHLDWSRQDVQAHAAAWMWAAGRQREWAGAGC